MKEQYTAPILEITELPEIKTDDVSSWYLSVNTDWFNS